MLSTACLALCLSPPLPLPPPKSRWMIARGGGQWAVGSGQWAERGKSDKIAKRRPIPTPPKQALGVHLRVWSLRRAGEGMQCARHYFRLDRFVMKRSYRASQHALRHAFCVARQDQERGQVQKLLVIYCSTVTVVQYSTVQSSPVQYSPVQCSTVQYVHAEHGGTHARYEHKKWRHAAPS